MKNGGQGGVMSRILVLMDHKENRRLLVEWLATRYTVLPQETDEAVDEPYDLGILDGTALDRLADSIEARKESEKPVFLPFLLVTAGRQVGFATRRLWKSIDEVIHSPIDQVELQARMEVLLRARRQALALRQAGERALMQSEERLGLMIEGVPDYALFLIDPSAHVSGWNTGAERLLGYEAEEIIGRPFSQLFTSEDRQSGKPERELQTARTTGRASDDNWLVRKNGSRFWASGLTTALQNGSLRGYVKVCRDLSERKQVEEQVVSVLMENARLVDSLREADRRKDEFLATLAHELRNPLAPIKNALQIMQMSSDRAAREQARMMMERQLAQMVRLVDDLLDVSRITRDKIELRKERIELAAVVASAVETSRPVIDASGHELTVTLPPEPIPLDADLARLAQVFSNLLNNATKYMEPGGHIWLTAELASEGYQPPDEVLVKVRDAGLGIPADMLPKIFEMFTQVNRSLGWSQGGLGIGLTLVKRLVEMHGGSVEARSDGPGKGSEFTVRLPIAPASASHQPPKSEGEKTAAPARQRILVVDDNKDSADSMSMLLGIMGMEVRTAYDGLEAVEAAAAFNPDVVLMDIGMPTLNGYEAAARIREKPWGKDMVLVAVTGWGQEEDRRRSEKAGFNFHMVKPVDPAVLKQLLTELKATPS
jgi:PAS domain S-box-containing protein